MDTSTGSEFVAGLDRELSKTLVCSVADPDHFDADPDPIMLYIKFCKKIFCLKMVYKTYLLTEKLE
jgi:hypothetical protein